MIIKQHKKMEKQYKRILKHINFIMLLLDFILFKKKYNVKLVQLKSHITLQ
jgi:hypothetical protein